MGHKSRCFDCRYNATGDLLVSSSEDGTSKVFNLSSVEKPISIVHNINSEVLRSNFIGNNSDAYQVLTCGADGLMYLWAINQNKVDKIQEFSHGEAQIYGCEVIDQKVYTAADDQLFLWDLVQNNKTSWTVKKVYDNTAYGGVRNPENQLFIFDIKTLDPNILAMAISDGTVRIKDLRLKEEESDVQIFSLNISDTTTSLHATSVCWNSSGTSILASTGSGYVGVLDIRKEGGALRSLVQAHTTPCYGAMFTKGDSDCITWSSDGNIKLWKDINVAAGVIEMPAKTKAFGKSYPVYSCAISPKDGTIACAGGISTAFLGTPIHLLTLEAFT